MTTALLPVEKPNSVGEALHYCARALAGSDAFYGHGTDNSWDEAVQLVLTVAGLPLDSGDSVLAVPFTEQAARRLDELLRRRIDEHTPLPYLLGRAWFAGLEFLCDERAIIPRSPIAELIGHDFRPWYAGPGLCRVLDLCCGGGCIGLAAAVQLPGVCVDMVDLDPDAVALARDNIRHFSLGDRVRVFQSDLFQALGEQRYDLILSNPPYVDAGDLATMPAEYHHEPALALGSGSDGLALTRTILARAARHLSPGGLLVVEVGNSAGALEQLYPEVPFTWVEFESGGEGVFVLCAGELQEFSASFAG